MNEEEILPPASEPQAPPEYKNAASSRASKPDSEERAIEVIEEKSSTEDASQEDWTDPETVSSESGSPAKKRKRRRKKSKKPGDESEDEAASEGEESAEAAPRAKPEPKPQAPRIPLDAEQVSKLARKIYLAEISEEGVALVDDRSAKELSRRCFRLAEIFLEEQTRRN